MGDGRMRIGPAENKTILNRGAFLIWLYMAKNGHTLPINSVKILVREVQDNDPNCSHRIILDYEDPRQGSIIEAQIGVGREERDCFHKLTQKIQRGEYYILYYADTGRTVFGRNTLSRKV